MVDIMVSQLANHFRVMKTVLNAYKIVQPSILTTSSCEELCGETEKFANRFSDYVSPLFKAHILTVRNAFKAK